jgi:hypothetical protein
MDTVRIVPASNRYSLHMNAPPSGIHLVYILDLVYFNIYQFHSHLSCRTRALIIFSIIYHSISINTTFACTDQPLVAQSSESTSNNINDRAVVRSRKQLCAHSSRPHLWIRKDASCLAFGAFLLLPAAMPILTALYNNGMCIGQGFNTYTQTICLEEAVTQTTTHLGPGAPPTPRSPAVTRSSHFIEKPSDLVRLLDLSAASSIIDGVITLGALGSYDGGKVCILFVAFLPVLD